MIKPKRKSARAKRATLSNNGAKRRFTEEWMPFGYQMISRRTIQRANPLYVMCPWLNGVWGPYLYARWWKNFVPEGYGLYQQCSALSRV